MEKIIIETPDAISAIMVGARWEAVTKLIPTENAAVITDENVFGIYGKDFPDLPVMKIQPGEDSKKLRTVESLSGKLLAAGIDRSGFILAVGGGVVCDIAGFTASVFMRGIRCGYVSTTLLSQVDASTGGKTGVNFGKIKNVIGTFRQPEFVICDTTMLRTLPEDEYLSGLGELIKTGIIGDISILEILEQNQSGIIRRERDLLSELVSRSVKYKASIVAADEKESGLRRVLNFGHTFGHAIELKESVKHGFAVAAGISLASAYSHELGYISGSDCERITGLIKRYNLPAGTGMTPKTIEKSILHDKKKSGDLINFVFIEGIGKPVVKKVSLKDVTDFYKKHYKQKSHIK